MSQECSMLSKIFRSARSLIRSDNQEDLTTEEETTAKSDEGMVTTRGQAGSQSNASDSPRSNTRRTRTPAEAVVILNDDVTETLPVRVKEPESNHTRSRVEVVIPVSHLSHAETEARGQEPKVPELGKIEDTEKLPSTSAKILEAVRSLKEDPVEAQPPVQEIEGIENDESQDKIGESQKSQELNFVSALEDVGQQASTAEAGQPAKIGPAEDVSTKATNIQEIVEIYDSASGRIIRDTEVAKIEVLSPATGIATEENHSTNIQSTHTREEPTLAMPTPTNKKLSNAKMIALKPISSHVAAPAVEASKHKRFGSEEPEPFLSTAPEITEIFGDSSDDSNDDDSDDAPEEYNQETAVKDHVAQDQDAIKAIEIQKAALREKRKERDAKLTQQAEVANRKRKRNESSKQASSMKKLKAAESVAEAEDTMNIAVEDEPAMSVSRTHKFLTNDKLPEFLPAEFLQGDESEYEDTAPTTQAMIRKTTKRVVPVVKKPKDRQKGSTIYRVTETVDSRLAPKASLHARSEKARKMHGGNRKPFANGFFTSA